MRTEREDPAGASRPLSPGAITALLGQLAHLEAAPAAPPVLPGSRIGRFEVVREVGRGGFGVVYEGRDPLLGRSVALKLLRPERLREALGARALVEEAEAAAQVQHPNIVSIHELGDHDGTPYLVLELLEGETLADRLARGRMPSTEALAVANDVARAVAHAHARGVVHRDLKPANVFLCGDGTVKVLDFGLSLLAAESHRRASKDGGTPAYMCPEQGNGVPGDERADVFAVGVMLFQMLEGALPYAVRDGVSDATRPGETPRLRRRGTSRALRDLVARSMDRDPRVRPASGAELLARLESARRSAARRPRLVALALVAVAATSAGLAWRELRRERPEPPPTRSPEALALYHEALRCFDRSPSPDERCLPLLERAVAIDPEFALAWAEIPMRAMWMGRPLDELRGDMARALRHSDHLPAAQRLKLMAFAADVDGRETDASSLYQQAVAVSPDDRLLLMQAADFFMTREEPDLALPFWRRVFELQPVPSQSGSYVVFALAALRRLDDLRAFARQLESGPQNTAARVELAFARANLGDLAGALDAARAALAIASTDGERADGQRWVFHYRLRSAEGESLERDARQLCRSGQVRTFLSLHGRRRELLEMVRHVESPLAGCPAPPPHAFDQDFGNTSSIARLVAGHESPELFWSFARISEDLNPKLAAALAVFLAYDGDLEHAAELARPLQPGSPRRQVYEAVVQWRSGDVEGARRRLRALYERNPWTSAPPLLPPSFLYGELLAELGDDAGAVEALSTFHALDFPIEDFWTWAYPKSLYLLARSQERLGRAAEARAAVEKLLALWARADADLPLLAEARALQARLSTAAP